MMEMLVPEKITTDMINFWKSTALNMYHSAAALQEQTEKISLVMLEQTLNAQKEGMKIWQEWLASNKKTRDEFGEMIAGNFESMREFLEPRK